MEEFHYKINEKGRVPVSPNFSSELKEEDNSATESESYISTYPIAEWKKLAVCNFLVRMRSNGLSSEYGQLGNKGRRTWGGRS